MRADAASSGLSIGLFIPITFVEILGALLMTISDPAYPAAFAEGGTGGLLAQTISPWGGFGKFLLVVLALSTVSNNCANLYSYVLYPPYTSIR